MRRADSLEKTLMLGKFSLVQLLSHVRLSVSPRTAAHQASLSITNSRSLLKIMSIESVTISSSVVSFSSRLQSLPALGSFSVSQFFTSGGQSIGVSVSASVFPMNIQDWFPLGWTGLISLQSKRLSRVFSNTTVQKYKFFGTQLSFWSNSHIQTCLLETRALTRQIFVGKVMSLLFNMLSRLIIAFLPKNKCLFISWLQSPSAVILEPWKITSAILSTAMKWWDQVPWS